MVAVQCGSLVLIAVVEHWTVVASQYDERIARQPVRFKRLNHLAHRFIELQNGFAAQSERTLAAKTLVRHTRHVHIVGAEIHKERLLFIFLYEADSGCRDRICNILIAPKGAASAFHVPYAPDAVHDALVVPVARFEFGEQFGVCGTRRLAGEVRGVAH